MIRSYTPSPSPCEGPRAAPGVGGQPENSWSHSTVTIPSPRRTRPRVLAPGARAKEKEVVNVVVAVVAVERSSPEGRVERRQS